MDLHVFPIPVPPPTSLSTQFLWVFPVHQAWALVSCIQPGLVICFTIDNIYALMLFSLNIPPSPSPTESKSLFCICSDHWGMLFYLSLLFIGTLHSNGHIFPFLLCFSLLFFSQLFVRLPLTATCFYAFFSPQGWSWFLSPIQCHKPPPIVHQALWYSECSNKRRAHQYPGTPQRLRQNCVWASPVEVRVSSGVPQGWALGGADLGMA